MSVASSGSISSRIFVHYHNTFMFYLSCFIIAFNPLVLYSAYLYSLCFCRQSFKVWYLGIHRVSEKLFSYSLLVCCCIFSECSPNSACPFNLAVYIVHMYTCIVYYICIYFSWTFLISA